jgi:hypothetical protein
MPLHESDDMTIDQRIAAGDREAIYDAIVEAREALDIVRDDIGTLLADDPTTLERLRELSAKRVRHGEPQERRPRRKKDAAATDRSGKERQRSRINRSASASQGR